MEFVCNTRYSQKALTAMARGLRKTVRARRNRVLRVISLAIIAFCLVSIYLAWGDTWRVAFHGGVALMLALVSWKEDALNGMVAGKQAIIRGMEATCTTFQADAFEIQTSKSVTRWQYESILAMAESRGYIIFAMGKNHAIVLDKQGLEGGSVEAFRAFLEKQTGKTIKQIGGV